MLKRIVSVWSLCYGFTLNDRLANSPRLWTERSCPGVLHTFNPDLVLLDINMPVKDGFQAARRCVSSSVEGHRAPSRILAVTALSSDAHKRQGLLESGIDEWMTKPVVIRSLRDEVVRLKRTLEKSSSPEAQNAAGVSDRGKQGQ